MKIALSILWVCGLVLGLAPLFFFNSEVNFLRNFGCDVILVNGRVYIVWVLFAVYLLCSAITFFCYGLIGKLALSKVDTMPTLGRIQVKTNGAV